MRTKLKKVADTEQKPNLVSITDYQIGQNQHEINCGRCGRIFFADKQTFEGFDRAIRQDLDKPFICTDCQKQIRLNSYKKH